MRTPGQLDLFAWRNAAFETRLTLFENGVPLNLTGITPTLQIRVQPGQTGTPVLEATTASGLAIVSATEGLIDFNIAQATLGAFPAPTVPEVPLALFWDLRMVPAAGFAFIAASGRFYLNAGVTR